MANQAEESCLFMFTPNGFVSSKMIGQDIHATVRQWVATRVNCTLCGEALGNTVRVGYTSLTTRPRGEDIRMKIYLLFCSQECHGDYMTPVNCQISQDNIDFLCALAFASTLSHIDVFVKLPKEGGI